jgi:hypothetical protein
MKVEPQIDIIHCSMTTKTQRATRTLTSRHGWLITKRAAPQTRPENPILQQTKKLLRQTKAKTPPEEPSNTPPCPPQKKRPKKPPQIDISATFEALVDNTTPRHLQALPGQEVIAKFMYSLGFLRSWNQKKKKEKKLNTNQKNDSDKRMWQGLY